MCNVQTPGVWGREDRRGIRERWVKNRATWGFWRGGGEYFKLVSCWGQRKVTVLDRENSSLVLFWWRTLFWELEKNHETFMMWTFPKVRKQANASLWLVADIQLNVAHTRKQVRVWAPSVEACPSRHPPMPWSRLQGKGYSITASSQTKAATNLRTRACVHVDTSFTLRDLVSGIV